MKASWPDIRPSLTNIRPGPGLGLVLHHALYSPSLSRDASFRPRPASRARVTQETLKTLRLYKGARPADIAHIKAMRSARGAPRHLVGGDIGRHRNLHQDGLRSGRDF